MKWFKIISSGFAAWIVPFVFNTLIFPEIPLALQFIIYMLTACFFMLDYSNSIMNGYLQKRSRITVQIGLALGFTWFVIGFLGSAVYFLFIKQNPLFEFSVNHGSIYLIYPILGILIGICEEKRGRKR